MGVIGQIVLIFQMILELGNLQLQQIIMLFQITTHLEHMV
jgi:hypothetical protein